MAASVAQRRVAGRIVRRQVGTDVDVVRDRTRGRFREIGGQRRGIEALRWMGGEHTASPVYADGRIYFFDVKGAGHVVSADREGRVLARNELDEGCMASPAIVGKALYVRTKTHLYRIEQGAKLP